MPQTQLLREERHLAPRPVATDVLEHELLALRRVDWFVLQPLGCAAHEAAHESEEAVGQAASRERVHKLRLAEGHVVRGAHRRVQARHVHVVDQSVDDAHTEHLDAATVVRVGADVAVLLGGECEDRIPAVVAVEEVALCEPRRRHAVREVDGARLQDAWRAQHLVGHSRGAVEQPVFDQLLSDVLSNGHVVRHRDDRDGPLDAELRLDGVALLLSLERVAVRAAAPVPVVGVRVLLALVLERDRALLGVPVELHRAACALHLEPRRPLLRQRHTLQPEQVLDGVGALHLARVPLHGLVVRQLEHLGAEAVDQLEQAEAVVLQVPRQRLELAPVVDADVVVRHRLLQLEVRAAVVRAQLVERAGDDRNRVTEVDHRLRRHTANLERDPPAFGACASV